MRIGSSDPMYETFNKAIKKDVHLKQHVGEILEESPESYKALADQINADPASVAVEVPKGSITFSMAPSLSQPYGYIKSHLEALAAFDKESIQEMTREHGIRVSLTCIDPETQRARGIAIEDDTGKKAIYLNPKLLDTFDKNMVQKSTTMTFNQELANLYVYPQYKEHEKLAASGHFEKTYKNDPPLQFSSWPKNANQFIKILLVLGVTSNPSVHSGFAYESIEAKAVRGKSARLSRLNGTRFDIRNEVAGAVGGFTVAGPQVQSIKLTDEQITRRNALTGHAGHFVLDHQALYGPQKTTDDFVRELYTQNAGVGRDQEGALTASKRLAQSIVKTYEENPSNQLGVQVAFLKDFARRIHPDQPALDALVYDRLNELPHDQNTAMTRHGLDAAMEGRQIIQAAEQDSFPFESAVTTIFPHFSFDDHKISQKVPVNTLSLLTNNQ